jgi:hypothetical protein
MQKRPDMPPGLATRVYDVLVEECGARDGEFDRMNFVIEYERCTREPGPPSEYRFKGDLGFGGKFHYPSMKVDCYPEDENASTLRKVEAANARLAILAEELQAALARRTCEIAPSTSNESAP